MHGFFLEHANFIPADPMKTPEHIAPVWYFTPFYSVLRAIPDKFAGVIGMGGAIVVLFFLPWLDRCKVKSVRYRGGIYKKALFLFVVSFLILGYLGTQPPTPVSTIIARICTAIYFGFFLLMPVYTRWEKLKPVPTRVTYQPSLDDRLRDGRKLYEEITVLLPAKPEQAASLLGQCTFFRRRPNPAGIRKAAKRFAKTLKTSLD